ncbi:squalene/phytoene synthase family protein [Phragmitibacter flavus]|nr:squalene/phytoene synthase family protein [Phragmitibacter flavus]
MSDEKDLGGKLLAEVSRSFYLTLKALPEGVREPLSLAYLMARAADTLADTTVVPGEVRLGCLRDFDGVVQVGAEEQGLMARLKSEFMPLQEDEGERKLLDRLPEVVKAYRASDDVDRTMTRGVLGPIVKGQMLDIERFPQDGQVRALVTAAELDEYTWLVAGCVGEFWTKLCVAKLGASFASGTTADEMVRKGVNYGKGLQLVNILRDVAKDGRMGRCYLPLTEIEAVGLTMEEVRAKPAVLLPLTVKWRELAREYLMDGLAYVEALEMKRLRYATALPLLLGFKTLVLIERASQAEWLAGLKVPRGETTKLLFEAGIASATRNGISKLAAKCMG